MHSLFLLEETTCTERLMYWCFQPAIISTLSSTIVYFLFG